MPLASIIWSLASLFIVNAKSDAEKPVLFNALTVKSTILLSAFCAAADDVMPVAAQSAGVVKVGVTFSLYCNSMVVLSTTVTLNNDGNCKSLMVWPAILAALLPARSRIWSLVSSFMTSARSAAVKAVLFSAFTVRSTIELSAFCAAAETVIPVAVQSPGVVKEGTTSSLYCSCIVVLSTAAAP